MIGMKKIHIFDRRIQIIRFGLPFKEIHANFALALHKFLSSSIVEIREKVAFSGQMLDA